MKNGEGRIYACFVVKYKQIWFRTKTTVDNCSLIFVLIIFDLIFKVIARCLKQNLFFYEKRRFGQWLYSLRQIFLQICKGGLGITV